MIIKQIYLPSPKGMKEVEMGREIEEDSSSTHNLTKPHFSKPFSYTQRTPRKKQRRKPSTYNPFTAMRNEMGREGEEETYRFLGQEVKEEERKKMMCLVSLRMPPISTCKKREVKRRIRRKSSSS